MTTKWTPPCPATLAAETERFWACSNTQLAALSRVPLIVTLPEKSREDLVCMVCECVRECV